MSPLMLLRDPRPLTLAEDETETRRALAALEVARAYLRRRESHYVRSPALTGPRRDALIRRLAAAAGLVDEAIRAIEPARTLTLPAGTRGVVVIDLGRGEFVPLPPIGRHPVDAESFQAAARVDGAPCGEQMAPAGTHDGQDRAHDGLFGGQLEKQANDQHPTPPTAA